MPQKTLKVQPGVLENSANVINGKIGEYSKAVGAIYSSIENLNVEWKGKTSDEFKKNLSGYKKDLDKMAEVLAKYSESLVKAAKKYNETDAALAINAQKLKSGRF